jgi:hypothetical protein
VPGLTVFRPAEIVDVVELRTKSCWNTPPGAPKNTKGEDPKFSPSMVSTGEGLSKPKTAAWVITTPLLWAAYPPSLPSLCANDDEHKPIKKTTTAMILSGIRITTSCV